MNSAKRAIASKLNRSCSQASKQSVAKPPKVVIYKDKKFDDLYNAVPNGKLGEGFAGEVFKVKKKGGKEVFACKSLKEQGHFSVKNEVDALRVLTNHPNIMRLVAVIDDRETAKSAEEAEVYLIYELVPGVPLGKVIED